MEDRKSTEQLLLHTEGDVELWLAKGDTWCLPVHIHWLHDRNTNKRYAQVTPAVSLYQSQALVMASLLKHHDIGGSTVKWVIPRKIAEAILHKAPGVTPSFYYSWPDANCPPLAPNWSITRLREQVKEPLKSWACDSFVQHVATARNIPSSVVKLVLNAIGDEAPKWLLEHMRPLDLGFCRIVALPFRANWKEIVMFKCRKWNLRRIFSMKDKESWAELEKLGLPGVLCSPHNVAMRRSMTHEKGRNRIDYTLETIPTKTFHEATNMIEARRMSCGPSSYVASYEQAVEKLYYYAVRALDYYVKKVSLPLSRLHVRRDTRNLMFLPIGKQQVRVHGTNLANLPVHIVPPDSSFSVTAEGSDPRLIQTQTEAVPKVPTIPKKPKDMWRRKEQRLLGPPGEREAGANGLSMLAAGEGEATGGSVLPIATTDGQPPRMDDQ